MAARYPEQYLDMKTSAQKISHELIETRGKSRALLLFRITIKSLKPASPGLIVAKPLPPFFRVQRA